MSDIYQEIIMEVYKNPMNFGKLENPDYHALSHNPLCGDNLELFIKTENSMIKEIKYSGKGCAISQVSASLLTEHLKGKTIEQAEKMKKENVLRLIKIDLSKNPSRMKCALLSLEVLKKALEKA